MVEIIIALAIGFGSAATYLKQTKPEVKCEKSHCEQTQTGETK